MISKTEDLIKKVMLKAQQLTETSEEKIYEKIYRINMQHIEIISLFYSRLQSFMIFLQIPLSKSLSQSLYLEGCKEKTNLKISI